jgi:hypothetical protein
MTAGPKLAKRHAGPGVQEQLGVSVSTSTSSSFVSIAVAKSESMEQRIDNGQRTGDYIKCGVSCVVCHVGDRGFGARVLCRVWLCEPLIKKNA